MPKKLILKGEENPINERKITRIMGFCHFCEEQSKETFSTEYFFTICQDCVKQLNEFIR